MLVDFLSNSKSNTVVGIAIICSSSSLAVVGLLMCSSCCYRIVTLTVRTIDIGITSNNKMTTCGNN
jgi:hypothetical protein